MLLYIFMYVYAYLAFIFKVWIILVNILQREKKSMNISDKVDFGPQNLIQL